MDELGFFGDPLRMANLANYQKEVERVSEVYNFFEFISEEEMNKIGEEADRLSKRETELWEKWRDYDFYHEQQYVEIESDFGDSP